MSSQQQVFHPRFHLGNEDKRRLEHHPTPCCNARKNIGSLSSPAVLGRLIAATGGQLQRRTSPVAFFTAKKHGYQKVWMEKSSKIQDFRGWDKVKKNSWNKSLVDNQKSDTPKPQSRKKNTFPFMLRILRNSNLLRLTYSVKPSKSLPIWFFNAGKCICLFKILTTALHMAKNCLVFYNLFINAGLALTIHIQFLQKK